MLGRDAVPAGMMPHTSSPRAALGATSPGALRLRAGPTAVGGESRMMPRWRAGWRDASRDMRRTRRPRVKPGGNLRADLRAIQVPRHLGAPYPSLWGTGKETGHPQPAAEQGPASVGYASQ